MVDFKGIIEDIKSTIEVKDRFFKFRKYKNCFLGSDCVIAIIKLGYATNTIDAVAIGGFLYICI